MLCCPASFIPHLKLSPGSPPSGKLVVFDWKPELEGDVCVGCSVMRAFWRGICLVTTVISKKIVLRVGMYLLKGWKK